MKDFDVRKFYTYHGPNYYLNRQAVVFNIYFDPAGKKAESYHASIVDRFPELDGRLPDRIAELFATVLVHVLKMDIDLFISGFAISRDGDEDVIAVAYLDDRVATDCAYFVSDWFKAMSDDRHFDFQTLFAELQEDFDRTLFGGPTIYSLIEAGLKRGIPVQYLEEENQFQWGYGKRQIRGRSTTLHTDGIKDTEFTMYKDMVKDFLLMCGFPTPTGKNCFAEDEIVAEAKKLGFPVVVKPLAGHKGEGVTTNIESEAGVRKAFQTVAQGAQELGVPFDGAIVEQQVYGTDHRLLAVNGKFAAALERVPAYVDGDGIKTIAELIALENDKEVRLDNARSPLCKIKIDDDLRDFLSLQNLDLKSVPKADERVFLRRVANISAGGVSINVTDKIHPKNVKLVDDIAGFFNVTCLGIDVLAEDVSKPWDESPFGIIEINAGPGVFMHLAPALGGSIDVPGKIMRAHFPKPGSERIPIVAGNCITESLCSRLYQAYRAVRPEGRFGALTQRGISFDNEFFFKNPSHEQNVKILLRHPAVDFAIIHHDKDDIFDDGTWHEGADVVILHDPHEAEEILERDLLPGGTLIKVLGTQVTVWRDGEEVASREMDEGAEVAAVLADILAEDVTDLVTKYD